MPGLFDFAEDAAFLDGNDWAGTPMRIWANRSWLSYEGWLTRPMNSRVHRICFKVGIRSTDSKAWTTFTDIAQFLIVSCATGWT
jgi:hypothetical protein